MRTVTENWIIYFSVIIINLITLSVSQVDSPSFYCDGRLSYTTDSTYAGNLNYTLSSLASYMDSGSYSYGFYSESSGETPDTVNLIALCRGDVQPADCRSCLNNLIVSLPQKCPVQTAAFGWHEYCMLRYSNWLIFGTLDASLVAYSSDSDYTSNVEQFNQVLENLMEQLGTNASERGPLKYSSGNRILPDELSTIYGLVQCTPDLSEAQCLSCLRTAIGYIPTDGNIGRQVVLRSCNIRYDDNGFFNDTTVVLAQPPLLSPPSPPAPPPPSRSPPPPPPPSPDNGSNTTPTVVIIVVSALVVIISLLG